MEVFCAAFVPADYLYISSYPQNITPHCFQTYPSSPPLSHYSKRVKRLWACEALSVMPKYKKASNKGSFVFYAK